LRLRAANPFLPSEEALSPAAEKPVDFADTKPKKKKYFKEPENDDEEVKWLEEKRK